MEVISSDVVTSAIEENRRAGSHNRIIFSIRLLSGAIRAISMKQP